ncbi:hypothetical protein CSTAT_13345 (plasmid) [Corynebacterium stationis]|nr:hypothetical protein CSTAT_13345 [Corynebacterium stationis]
MTGVDVHNPRQPSRAFDHRSDLRLTGADDEISLPVPDLGPVISLRRALGDRHGVFDLGAPLPTGRVGACLPDRPAGTETFLQGFRQHTPGLDEQ